ncbi:MAG: sulfurtransferase [Actinobacteria bacterium]|nr:sulfurtransferase [Actinomycetota bacterium]
MDASTLVTVDELRAELGSPGLVILDARFSLDDEEWGGRAYNEGHIPGATYANTATHLSGKIVPGVTGRRPFPDPDAFARQLGEWGIDDSAQVVAYDADGGLMSAARVWLMLRWMGHDRVAVLDGGWQAWAESGAPIQSEREGLADPPGHNGVRTPAPTTFTARVRPDLLAEVDEVALARQKAHTCVFDSRGEEGYHGRGVYHDPVRGHIAGAGLADRAQTLAPDKRFRSPDELSAHYKSLIGNQAPQDIIFYCGSGITAAQNVLAMTIAGLPGSRMYVGSWSEWINDPTRPIEL